MKVCKIENLFGYNDYYCEVFDGILITKDGINYLPFDFVRSFGYIWEPEDVKELNQSDDAKKRTLVVSYKNIYGDNNYSSEYDKYAVEKDGIRYLTLDFIRKTTLSIMGCEIEEVEI